MSERELAEWFAKRMSFIMEAITLRELRGRQNEPVHNAAIVYEMYGWPFDEKDAMLIREEQKRVAALRTKVGDER